MGPTTDVDILMELHKAKVAVDCDENEKENKEPKWQIKMRDDSYCLFHFSCRRRCMVR